MPLGWYWASGSHWSLHWLPCLSAQGDAGSEDPVHDAGAMGTDQKWELKQRQLVDLS